MVRQGVMANADRFVVHIRHVKRSLEGNQETAFLRLSLYRQHNA